MTSLLTPPLHIGPIEVDPPVVLAPMAGVTNASFRRLCRQFGAGLYVSEMLGARAIVENHARTCPAPKVTRHGGGAALPFKWRLFESIVTAAIGAAGPIPVTIKFRMGIDAEHLTLLRDLTEAFAGRPITPPPGLGEVAGIMIDHARLLVDQFGPDRVLRSFRKHPAWYLNGFVVGGDVRRRLSAVRSVDEIDELMAGVDLKQDYPTEAVRSPRGHTHGPRPVKLPHGYLNDPDALDRIPRAAGHAVSGG